MIGTKRRQIRLVFGFLLIIVTFTTIPLKSHSYETMSYSYGRELLILQFIALWSGCILVAVAAIDGSKESRIRRVIGASLLAAGLGAFCMLLWGMIWLRLGYA